MLKRLHPRLTADPQFVAMFVNEARIAANLAHPNIIHIYELFQDGPGFVIAMEYVRGGTVLSLLRERHRRGTQEPSSHPRPRGSVVRPATAVTRSVRAADPVVPWGADAGDAPELELAPADANGAALVPAEHRAGGGWLALALLAVVSAVVRRRSWPRRRALAMTAGRPRGKVSR